MSISETLTFGNRGWNTISNSFQSNFILVFPLIVSRFARLSSAARLVKERIRGKSQGTSGLFWTFPCNFVFRFSVGQFINNSVDMSMRKLLALFHVGFRLLTFPGGVSYRIYLHADLPIVLLANADMSPSPIGAPFASYLCLSVSFSPPLFTSSVDFVFVLVSFSVILIDLIPKEHHSLTRFN